MRYRVSSDAVWANASLESSKTSLRAGAFALSMFMVACGSTSAQAKPNSKPQDPPSDARITEAVEDELAHDRAIKLAQIEVETRNGIVTLNGNVDNLLAKEHALRLAQTIRGVRSVINRIQTVPAVAVDDRALRNDVQNALFYDRATDSYEIDVVVKQAAVTLTGQVQSYAEKDLAERVVKGVKGVQHVNNQLAINTNADRQPTEIKADIEKRLRWDALVDHELIEVDVGEGGKVQLSGAVGSVAERARATSDAWVAGVTAVDANRLNVEYWAYEEGRKLRHQPASDSEIEAAIRDALRLDPRVSSFDVKPTAAAGIVVLRGAVDNVQARNAAAQVARSTTGVVRVNNRIAVRPPRMSDARIESRVISALTRHPYLDEYEIAVDSVGGVVFLSGEVDSYHEKLEADRVAAKAAGVSRVQNGLEITYANRPLVYDPHVSDAYPYAYDWYDYQPYRTFASDSTIRDEIEDELWWSPFVDSNEVRVTVSDGVARLEGTVDSYTELHAAVENAYEGGAVWVDNDLKVGR